MVSYKMELYDNHKLMIGLEIIQQKESKGTNDKNTERLGDFTAQNDQHY